MPSDDLTPAEELHAAAALLHSPACGMRKAVAESLAAWLETCANDLADARHYIDEPNSCEHAFAFARSILGEAAS